MISGRRIMIWTIFFLFGFWFLVNGNRETVSAAVDKHVSFAVEWQAAEFWPSFRLTESFATEICEIQNINAHVYTYMQAHTSAN